MSKEVSTPPPERINLRYTTEKGNAQEERELPFKILMVGDYTGKADPVPLETRKPLKVDKDTFNDVLAGQKISLTLEVPDRLTDEENATRSVELRFNSLADFRPENIAEQVPEMKKVLELRNAVSALKGSLSIADFRKTLQRVLQNPDERRLLMKELGLSEQDLTPTS